MRHALPFALLCVLTALLPAQTFVFNDFSSVAGIALNGNAAQFGTDLRLTPNSYSQTSSAWWNTPVPVAFGFNTRFSFSMTQPVVQSRTALTESSSSSRTTSPAPQRSAAAGDPWVTAAPPEASATASRSSSTPG